MRLEILDRLGAGDTYRGLLWPAKQPVAVRKLSNWSTLSISHLRAIAESIVRLQHPNIVELVGIQDNPADPCFIFEWVDGVDLRQLLAHAPLPVSAALHVARGVLSALEHAHSYGVVHGRLSPSKVLISRTGHVKVTGLGVHRSTRSPLAAGDALLSALPYVSPEQLRGDVTDHRSDIFIAGVLLYQLLTGQSPFGGTTNGMLRAFLSGAHRPDLQLTRHLPAPLESLLGRLLSPRSARHQGAEEVLAELGRIGANANGRDALIRHLDSRLPTNWASIAAAGDRASRYQVQERLGSGGMGEVWRGTRRLGHGPPQTVAFKFVRDRRQHGQATIEQVEREARTAMTLHHHNIAAVYDVAEVGGRPCIVMEYVDGIDLRRLSRRLSLPPDLVRCILRDVLSGLQHAHERGVLHRDLSPANIMIDRDGVARLMDFGVARNLNDSHSLGMLVGTAPFMAPETLEAQQWSRASDVYSLGAVAYYVLTSTPPYGHGDRLEVLTAMRSRELRPLPDNVPADLRAFIMAALHPSYERRQADPVAAGWGLGPHGQGDRELLGAEVRRAMSDDDAGGADRSGLDWAPEGTGNGPATHADGSPVCGQPGRPDPALTLPWRDPSTTSPTWPRFSGSLRTQEAPMDAEQRFLEKLSSIVSDLPVLRTDGYNAEPHDDLYTPEVDITLLYRRYEELSDDNRAAIEQEWIELGVAIDNANTAHHLTRELYYRFADKLGLHDLQAFFDADTAPLHKVNGRSRLAVVRTDVDNLDVVAVNVPRVRQTLDDRGQVDLLALPNLPVDAGEPRFVGPAPTPGAYETPTKPKRRQHRLAVVGGTLIGVAAVVAIVLMPDPQPVHQIPTVTERAPIQQLPLEEGDYPVCESPAQTSEVPTAPAIAPPKRRKKSKAGFLSEMDTVRVRRENKPDLLVTVTEESDDGESTSTHNRSHAVDTREVKGTRIEFPIDEETKLNLDFGQ